MQIAIEASPTFQFSNNTWYVFGVTDQAYAVGRELTNSITGERFIVGVSIKLARTPRNFYAAKWALTPA
jgi:hypothetical protein